MSIEVEITKSIKNKGKTFYIGNDIHFILCKNNKEYDCFAVIKDIRTNGFVTHKVMIDRMNVSDDLFIKYDEIKDQNISYTDTSWF